MLKLKFMLVGVMLFAGLAAYAQTGKISGKVIDAGSGEEITGATIYLKGKMYLGTMSDIEGRFLIENIPFGSDTLIVSYLSKANFILVVNITNTTTINVNVALEESVELIDEVIFNYEVKIDRKKMDGVLLEIKRGEFSANGLSAEVFKVIPISNTGEALKLVSGATLQGGKFAIIRGLNERYNLAMINNSPLPSTEPEKRAFSLDLFPTNMLDQILIVKSATPEYPGDWAGGIILIRTKDVPDDPFFTASLSSSINSLTTFKSFQQTEKLKNDWMGMGNKARQLPNGFPATQDIFTAKNTNRALLADYAKLLPNRYAYSETSALPNASLNISAGRNFKIGDSSGLGIIFSGLYGNSRAYKPAERYWWTTNGVRALRYADSTYESDTRVGAMLNITFKLGNKSKFALKNTYNHNGEDQFTKRSGARDAEGTYLQSFSYLYTYNRMFYTQLSGEHLFRLPTDSKKDRPVFDFASSTLSWEGGYGNTLRNMPDYRNVEYQSQEPSEEPYRLKLLPQNGSEDVSRLFTSLNEDIKGLSIKLKTPYEFNPMWSGSVKVGFNHQFKNRYFNGRFLSYSRPSSGFKFDLLQRPVGELFDPSSFFYNGSSGPNGILMDEITRPYHSYFAQASLNAGFLQLETKYGTSHRFIYGARMESYHQILESKGQNGEDVRIDTVWKNILPSFNYVYEINNKTNLRASYFRSLSRPDFRELAPFSFLDFQTFSILKGNPDLKLTTIDNAEVRYEVYPKPGEVYSVSLFYKRFENPIELLLDNSITLGAIGRLYANLPLANSFGIEFDFRKNLAFIDSLSGKSFFGRFTTYGNLTYIKSTIDLQGQTNTFNAKRPMQGQSPYIINLGLQWESKNEKWIVSGLVNRYGERIYNVGTATLPDIYEKARTVVDMQISRKMIDNKLELKISLQDLLAQDLLYFFDYDSNKKYTKDQDRIVYLYKMPRMVGFGASYKF